MKLRPKYDDSNLACPNEQHHRRGGTFLGSVMALVLVVLCASIFWGTQKNTPSANATAGRNVNRGRLVAATVSTSPVSLWPATTPNAAASTDGLSVTLGVKFSSTVAGTVTGVNFYKFAGNSGVHVGDLWSANGQKLAEATFTNEGSTGWQQVNFSQPVAITAGTTYVASYYAPVGHYAESNKFFQGAYTNGPLTAPSNSQAAGNGVYVYGHNGFPTSTWAMDNYWVGVVFTPGSGSSTPPTTPPTTATPPSTTKPTTPPSTTKPTTPPTTAAPQPGGFPTAANTGVPKGTNLTAYTGPTTITQCGTVIDSKIVSGGINVRVGNGTHSAATPCVTIKNSLINGPVNDNFTGKGYGPVVLTDDEVAGASAPATVPLIGATNFYAFRVNAHGGGYALTQCDGYCELHDSFVHDMFFVSPNHYDAFITNGNYGAPIVLDHNSLLCAFPAGQSGSSGGCSADVGLFGDFSAITNITVTNNLLMANPSQEYYCAYTGTHLPTKAFPIASNVVWKNNTFQRGSNGKCGGAGPVADWAGGNGNVFSGNKWDDGTALNMG